MTTESRHSTYWFEDGSVVLLVETTFYNLHRSFLAMKSPVWKDMFSMPVGVQSDVEGVTEKNPIVIPQVTVAEFNELLSFIYHDWHPPPERPERLVALLRLGNLFQIDDAKEFAIASLSSHPDIHPTLKLQLSRQYTLEEWLAPAFRTLLRLPLASLTPAEVDRLGLFAYSTLAKAKESVDEHRKEVAQSFPVVNLPYRHPNCFKSWKATWWIELGQLILSSDWSSWQETMNYIAGNDMPGVCEACKPRYAHEVQEHSKIWAEQEEQLIEDAIAVLR